VLEYWDLCHGVDNKNEKGDQEMTGYIESNGKYMRELEEENKCLRKRLREVEEDKCKQCMADPANVHGVPCRFGDGPCTYELKPNSE
jgi:hypothetical protein